MSNLVGLGRVASKDERDLLHLLPRKAAAAENIARKIWPASAVLDQKNTSQCVAYSTRQWLRSSPVRQDMPMSEVEFYKACQQVDEWPGDDYDGTSVRAAMKQLVILGFASGYEWAFSIEPILIHLLTKGPVVVGTDWTIDSCDTDRHGYIHFGGNSVGGHAWLLIGADRERKNQDGTKGALRMINSWGKGWGNRGRAWVTFDAMDLLLRHDGEAAAAQETKRT